MEHASDRAIRVGAFDAKNRLSELLRRVERGDSFVITRRGRAVARLVPPGDGERRLDLAELRDSLQRTRSRIAGTLDVLELVREGRRR